MTTDAAAASIHHRNQRRVPGPSGESRVGHDTPFNRPTRPHPLERSAYFVLPKKMNVPDLPGATKSATPSPFKSATGNCIPPPARVE